MIRVSTLIEKLGIRGLVVSMATWLLIAPAATAQTVEDLFDDSQLHDVKLFVHSSDWQALKANYSENRYYPADLEWRGVRVRNVGIRSRGMASRNEFKPGLRIDMNRYVEGQRFLGLRALVLDNAYRDISTIRERVSMKLFARMGIPAPREAHARLYVNNTLQGVYVLTEELGEEFVARAFTKPESEEPDRGTLFEYKWEFEYAFTYLGGALEPYQQIFEPRTHENDSVSELYAPVEEMVRLVNQSAGDQFIPTAGARLDLAQVVKYVAIERFLAEYDGFLGYKGMANFYLYRYAHDGRAIFVPWDKDQTFNQANLQIGQGLGDNELVKRAIGVPELRQVYLDTLAACASAASEIVAESGLPWLVDEVTRADRLVRDAIAADPNRWFSFDDYRSEITRMLEFARTRPGFVACEVENANRPAPLHVCTAPDDQPPR